MGDVDEMAANALQILGDDRTLEKFKENAVVSARRFDIEKVVPLYEALYEKAFQSRFDKVYDR